MNQYSRMGRKVEVGEGGNTQRDFFVFYPDHRNEPYRREWIGRKRELELNRRK